MRVRLLIDVATDDLGAVQRWVAAQPLVRIEVGAQPGAYVLYGRFVGAKEAHDGGAAE